MINGRNEAKVIQDIGWLPVPSAEARAACDPELRCLIESVNEGWNNSIPLTGTRPQPDYSVGFKREAFSDDQLHKLSPFIGEFLFGDQSFFMATYHMYFPFLACEVECGAAGLDIADLKKCAQHDACSESCRRAFPARQTREGDPSGDPRLLLLARSSFCPNLQSLRRDDGAKTTFYRHPIRGFSFWELKGKEKWTAHKSTTNIYHVWMPTHFQKTLLRHR